MSTQAERYIAATRAVQSGVEIDMATNMDPEGRGAATRKQLLCGILGTGSDHTALVKLLVEKGIITLDEYNESAIGSAEELKAAYERELTERFGGIPIVLI